MSIPVDTRLLDVQTWTAQSTTILAPYGLVPKLLDPDAWQQWAACVILIPAVAALNPPRPEVYPTWQQWGTAFNTVVRLLGT